jgi:hypothetical protein
VLTLFETIYTEYNTQQNEMMIEDTCERSGQRIKQKTKEWRIARELYGADFTRGRQCQISVFIKIFSFF